MVALPATRTEHANAFGGIALRRVSKTFDNGVTALDRLDLQVRAGEFLSLIGPSGCGKSTALRIMAGLAAPTSGSVEDAASGADIGFVFQEPTLMPWASVFDNVWLPLRLRGRTRKSVTFDVEAALALVGLGAFAGSFPSELSGGMKMRVSLARALVGRPRLLLLDEPFGALDEITRFRLNNDLIRLKAELGTTVVFVTHSVYESVYLSDRVVVMTARPGRVAADFRIEGPVPRTEAFRSSPAYVETCRTLSDALRAAMGSEDRL